MKIILFKYLYHEFLCIRATKTYPKSLYSKYIMYVCKDHQIIAISRTKAKKGSPSHKQQHGEGQNKQNILFDVLLKYHYEYASI